MSRLLLSLLVVLIFCSFSFADQPDTDFFKAEKAKSSAAFERLQQEYSRVKAFDTDGLTTRLYGGTFSFGASPIESAELFRATHANALGAEAGDLVLGSQMNKSQNVQQLMYNEITGEYKFTLVYYRQVRDGIPVYNSEARILVRNENDYPAVLASSTIRPLGDFKPTDFGTAKNSMAREAVLADNAGLDKFIDEELVIWAGTDKIKATPRMAMKLIGTNDFPEEWLYIIDAETGEILYKKDLILFEDVNGTVNGMATEGIGAEQCEAEVPMAAPYLRVNIAGGSTTYTDVDGNFTITNGGTSAVTVNSQYDGIYFDISYYGGTTETLSQSGVTPPGPVDFLFNSSNTSEYVRAQSNAYIYSNLVRDNALKYNPSYPAVSTQTNFPVSVNRTDGYCPGNAWYSPSEQSLNFCSSGSGYPNTAWQSVIHHEFGHHLVNMAGSGQDEYGEGMSDCVALIYVDDPHLGWGFYGDCTSSLRTADNTYQYPCSGSIHDCGQLLSGCVWDVRNALANTYPVTYMDTLSNLVINSILLHTGTSIDPQITIDFLTLDDDDATLDNGSPHYSEICYGFNLHNMDCPELSLVYFTYPNGRPNVVSPGVSTAIDFVCNAQTVEPVPGTGVIYYSVDGGSYTAGTVTVNGLNEYTGYLPPVDCGQTISWYVGAEANGYGMMYDPATAPTSGYSPVVATDYLIAFEDDFETDKGWTYSGGTWGRGTPTGGGGQYGDPDPSSAYEGDNVMGYNLNGDYENSMSERHATSPSFDCTGMVGTILKFYRWLGVEQPSYDHAYLRVSNDGSTWTTIWENTAEVSDGAWVYQEFDISAYADGETTVYIRFTMGTTDGSWQYCGWNIDNLEVSAYECDANSPQIATVSLPNWTEGIAYSEQFSAVGGTGALTWSDKNGDLAGSGMTLSSTGLFSGTPTSAGTIYFTAMVTDEALLTDEQALAFRINSSVSITTDSLPTWTEGLTYSEQVTSTGGTGSVVWSDKNGDLVGTGLQMTAGGFVNGIPTGYGTFVFTAEASDSLGSVDEQVLSIIINQAVALTTTSIADANKDNPYSFTIEAIGGTGKLIFSDKNNDLDGTGLSMATTGEITGTPLLGGDYPFTAYVVDALGSEDEQLFTLTVTELISIISGNLPAWTINNPYTYQLEAVGGIGNHTWTDKNGDLTGTGLTLSGAGLLGGTPTDTGLVSFTAEVHDETSQVDEKAFSIQLNPQIEILTASLPDWSAGALYSQVIGSQGGTGTVIMTDSDGGLAGSGLTLSPIGIVSGTASLGLYEFTAQATDDGGDTVTQIYSFTINPAVNITTNSLPEITLGGVYSGQLNSNGGTGAITWTDKNNVLDGTGLTITSAGLVSGTPLASGTINLLVRAQDEVGGYDEQTLAIVINAAMVIEAATLPDWTVGQPYSEQLAVAGGTGAKSWVDLYDDLVGTGLALGTDGLLSGSPTVEGAISFTASVADEGGGSAEQTFGLNVNPAVAITTLTAPNGINEEAYSLQLDATGGTGTITWVDLNGDLSGTGLSLSSTGLLDGTPNAVMTVTFTAEAGDITGSIATQEYTFDITPSFICGDANGDLAVNIIDITFLISYIYNGGAAPDPLESADVNANYAVNILDISYLIAYLYTGGPEPVCP